VKKTQTGADFGDLLWQSNFLSGTLTVTVDVMTLFFWAVSDRPKHTWNSRGSHSFTGDPHGLRIQEVSHVNRDSTPVAIYLFFFVEVIHLLVEETDTYYSRYLDAFDNEG
jgi:hypothetical protein